MNKIIIDPHFCSKEEYEELLEYLKEKEWDHKEVPDNVIKIGGYIQYSYTEGYDGEPNEADIEHITSQIKEGYNQGELITSNEDEEHRGWWSKVEFV